MADFDLIEYYKPLTPWEQREKARWESAPLSSEELEEDYIHSLTEERIFAGRADNVILRKHDRYRRIFEHSHDFFEMIYVARGECRNRIENETFVLTAGNFCLIAPGVRHTIGVFSDEGIVMNIIIRRSTFEQTFMRLLDNAHPLSAFFVRAIYSRTGTNYLLFRAGADPELYSLVCRMARESLYGEEFSPLILDNLVNMVFCLLMRGYADRLILSEMRHPTSAEAERILSCIYEAGLSVTLSDMARRFNYTESYLSALIKKLTGMTFTAIVAQIRVRHAKALLVTTELPIQEIARQCGYASVEHFCRTFRRLAGQTPTGYRCGARR